MLIRPGGTNPAWISPVMADKTSPLPVMVFCGLGWPITTGGVHFFVREQTGDKKGGLVALYERRQCYFVYIYVLVFIVNILFCFHSDMLSNTPAS